MINKYLYGVFGAVVFYISLFNIFENGRLANWIIKNKQIIKGVYSVTWGILYLIYLYFAYATDTTRPYFIQHIYLGLFIHLFLLGTSYRLTIYHCK